MCGSRISRDCRSRRTPVTRPVGRLDGVAPRSRVAGRAARLRGLHRRGWPLGAAVRGVPAGAALARRRGRAVRRPPVGAGGTEGPARALVRALKFRGALLAADAMASQIAANAPPAVLDRGRLVPVPLHPRRLRRRGFNQAERLAAAISARTGLRVCDCLGGRARRSRRWGATGRLGWRGGRHGGGPRRRGRAHARDPGRRRGHDGRHAGGLRVGPARPARRGDRGRLRADAGPLTSLRPPLGSDGARA